MELWKRRVFSPKSASHLDLEPVRHPVINHICWTSGAALCRCRAFIGSSAAYVKVHHAWDFRKFQCPQPDQPRLFAHRHSLRTATRLVRLTCCPGFLLPSSSLISVAFPLTVSLVRWHWPPHLLYTLRKALHNHKLSVRWLTCPSIRTWPLSLL